MKNIILIAVIAIFSTITSCSNIANKPIQSDTVAKFTLINSETLKDTAVYFSATGTEPFWNLDISNEQITLNLMDDSPITASPELVKAVDANVKMYRVNTEDLTLNIQLIQKECTNDMSGKVSPYSVRIEYKRKTDEKPKQLAGCGSYLIDKSLVKNWSLIELNGKKTTSSENNEVPSLVIGNDGKFSGFTDCNQMNGEVFFETGLLRFKNIATTRMFCGEENVEQEFLKTIKSVTTYKVEDNELELSNQNGDSLIFTASK